MGSPRQKEIFLAVDVGNTSTLIGTFNLTHSGNQLEPLRSFRIPTIKLKKYKTLAREWNLKTPSPAPTAILISSVVPAVNPILKKFFAHLFKITPEFVSEKHTGKLKNRYRVPKELGADRIVNGRGAMAYTKGACIVVDFGTATTFDCLSKKQQFLGGVIAPGPLISAEALYQRTARLPLVKLAKPAPIIGKNTLESILSGLYHGYRGLVTEIVTRLIEKLGPQTTLLATGGQAPLILKGLPHKFHYLPNLTLTGLLLLWEDIHREKELQHRG